MSLSSTDVDFKIFPILFQLLVGGYIEKIHDE